MSIYNDQMGKHIARGNAETAELTRLRAEVDAYKADAERYRWLRDVSEPPHNFYLSVPDEFAGVLYQPGEVDAYIDAARAALKEPT